MRIQQAIFMMAGTVLLAACNPAKEMKTTGSFERLRPSLDGVISANAKIEIIAEGFKWSEGPVWVESEKMLLFSDVPNNAIVKWTQEKGQENYLVPAGYTDSKARTGEMGSNGLLLDDEGNLVLCQHGDRRLAQMLAPIGSPKADFKTIADRYDGKRFNSPNDAVFLEGSYFMTDPMYGLEKHMEDPAKETPYQGVYHISPEGAVTLLTDTITRPNGLAFSPDKKYLFVANSDPEKARWYRFALTTDANGKVALADGKVFYDATANAKTEPGLPDGMKIDSKGNIFATGPGGVWIFDLEGNVQGKIRLPEPSSNCALSPDEKILYVTNNMYVLKVTMRE